MKHVSQISTKSDADRAVHTALAMDGILKFHIQEVLGCNLFDIKTKCLFICLFKWLGFSHVCKSYLFHDGANCHVADLETKIS